MQTRFQFRNVSFLFFSGISLLFLSCKKETTELEKNIEKWHSFKICNYTITRAISCYCLDKYTIPKSFKIHQDLFKSTNIYQNMQKNYPNPTTSMKEPTSTLSIDRSIIMNE